MLAIFEHNWRAMILWMVIAMLVDGFDGMLARWADVKKYANGIDGASVSYTHLRAHETVLDLVCRLLLETKKQLNTQYQT